MKQNKKRRGEKLTGGRGGGGGRRRWRVADVGRGKGEWVGQQVRERERGKGVRK